MGSSLRGCCVNNPISHPLGRRTIHVARFLTIIVATTPEVKGELRIAQFLDWPPGPQYKNEKPLRTMLHVFSTVAATEGVGDPGSILSIGNDEGCQLDHCCSRAQIM
jgi:hypothetical protein